MSEMADMFKAVIRDWVKRVDGRFKTQETSFKCPRVCLEHFFGFSRSMARRSFVGVALMESLRERFPEKRNDERRLHPNAVGMDALDALIGSSSALRSRRVDRGFVVEISLFLFYDAKMILAA